MGEEQDATQLVVIGAGPGGYPAAFLAADMGMRVTLIDPEANPGGVCLYRGCIPSKALLHVSAVWNEAREAEAFGVSFGKAKLDIDKLRSWKESVVKKLTGGLGQLGKQRKINYVEGRAVFKDPRTLRVTAKDGKERDLRFEHAIVSTGSRPAVLPFAEGIEEVMDSTAALALPAVPGTLLVVGGGYIGLELGQAYASFGSRVTVVEMLPALMAGADPDLAQVLAKRLNKQFDAIHLNTRVDSMKAGEKGVTVAFRDATDKTTEETFDRVLVSVGRKPNSADLGLENTSVKVLENGFIEVDRQRRTGEPSIFAIGDVAGEPMLAHKATHEARVAVEAIAGKKTVYDPAAIPAVVFTDPEVAWCGLTEQAATEQGIEVKVSKFPWAASGRATTLGRNDGLTKLVIDAGSEQVLGMGIAGPGAGEMIAEGVLAVEMGAVAEDLALAIHAHPTLSETVMEAAEGIYGNPIHFMSRR